MAKIAFSERAFQDFERIFDFHAEIDPVLAAAQVSAIQQGIAILAGHPLIGRTVDQRLRELVISKGKTGFVALYRFIPQRDVVWVLRIRHQRELGYPQA